MHKLSLLQASYDPFNPIKVLFYHRSSVWDVVFQHLSILLRFYSICPQEMGSWGQDNLSILLRFYSIAMSQYQFESFNILSILLRFYSIKIALSVLRLRDSFNPIKVLFYRVWLGFHGRSIPLSILLRFYSIESSTIFLASILYFQSY